MHPTTCNGRSAATAARNRAPAEPELIAETIQQPAPLRRPSAAGSKPSLRLLSQTRLYRPGSRRCRGCAGGGAATRSRQAATEVARPAGAQPPRSSERVPRGRGAPSRTPPAPPAPRAEEQLDAEVVLLHELVLSELLRGPALELDLAVDDDVAAVGDLRRLVEVLLGHQDRQVLSLLQLADLADDPAHQNGRQPHRGLVHQQDPGRGHERARNREHLLLASAHAAGELPASLAQDRKGLEADRKSVV